jgi:glycosyltransferase involved in cell wall biosynthesis
MRITIVTGPFLSAPPAPCGAVERRWYDLAARFAAAGHPVTFICRGYPGLAAQETIDGVRVRRLTHFTGTASIAVNLVKDFLFSLRMLPVLPRADILVVNAFWLPVLARWLRPGAGKVVLNVARMPKGQMWLYRGIGRLSAVSNATATAIIEQTPSVAPIIRVTPNPIDAAVFCPPPGGRRPKSPGEPRTFVFTGRIHPEKGLPLLIDAFARVHATHPGVRLRVIGPWQTERGGGGDAYLAELRARAGALPVEFVEPIYDRPALARALQEADCYCYPSLAEQGETFGIAPLEAMGTGLVTIVSDLDCFREFLRDGDTGYMFDHRGPDAVARLADVMARVLDDPDDAAAAVGRRAAARAATFDNAAIVEACLEDFRSLLPPDAAAATPPPTQSQSAARSTSRRDDDDAANPVTNP